MSKLRSLALARRALRIGRQLDELTTATIARFVDEARVVRAGILFAAGHRLRRRYVLLAIAKDGSLRAVEPARGLKGTARCLWGDI